MPTKHDEQVFLEEEDRPATFSQEYKKMLLRHEGILTRVVIAASILVLLSGAFVAITGYYLRQQQEGVDAAVSASSRALKEMTALGENYVRLENQQSAIAKAQETANTALAMSNKNTEALVRLDLSGSGTAKTAFDLAMKHQEEIAVLKAELTGNRQLLLEIRDDLKAHLRSEALKP